MPDYYQTLGISRGADEKEIKAAYRRMARKYHPDVNPGDKSAENKFKEIGNAHEVLGDPEKRALYDQYGDNWENARHMSGGEGDFGGVNFGGGGMGSFFEQFFGGAQGAGFQGGGFQGGRAPDYEVAQPRDIEREIELSLEDIDAGCSRTLTYQTMDAQRTRGDIATVPTTKKVVVTIPPGIPNGKKLRVASKGHAGLNGRAGDLYVTVKWGHSEKFKTVGENLEVEVPVQYFVAALGGEIKVPTLRGSVTMKIPAGTQSAQSFRLASQGITKLGGGRSDLMARIKITVPKALNPKEKELLEKIADLGVKA
jgi:DnaJ-class molecular chaperone